MTRATRCPQCGGANLETDAAGRLRCPACKREFVYRTATLPFLLTWIVVGCVVGIATFFLFAALGRQGTIWQWVVFGAVTAIVSIQLTRRFRTLEARPEAR